MNNYFEEIRLAAFNDEVEKIAKYSKTKGPHAKRRREEVWKDWKDIPSKTEVPAQVSPTALASAPANAAPEVAANAASEVAAVKKMGLAKRLGQFARTTPGKLAIGGAALGTAGLGFYGLNRHNQAA